MLHNNTAADGRGFVGSEWDEGTTDWLTQRACAAAREPAPTCYPGQTPCVRVAMVLSRNSTMRLFLATPTGFEPVSPT